MSSNGKQSRARIVSKILAHFGGVVPPVIRRINVRAIAERMTDTNISLATICAASPGLTVIEMVDLHSAEVAVTPPKGRKTFSTRFNLSPTDSLGAVCPCLETLDVPCFHILAAAMVLSEVSSASGAEAQLPEADWRTGISRLLGSKSLSRPKVLVAKESVALFFVLCDIFNGYEARPFIIGDSELPVGTPRDNDSLGSYLLSRAKDREFTQKIREVKVGDIPKLSLLNPTPLAGTLIKSALDQLQLNRMYFSPQRVYFWEGLSDQLVFLGRPESPLGERLRVIGEVLPVEMEVAHNESGLQLSPVVRHPHGLLSLAGSGVSVFFNHPLWLRSGSTIFRVNLTVESLNQLRQPGVISVPADGIGEFYERYLPEVITHLPFGLHNDNFIDLPETDPVPRIYLTEKEQELRVSLRFGYGEHEVGALKKVPPHSFSYGKEEGSIIRIPRQAEGELRWYNLLEASSTGLKSGARRDKTSSNVFLLRKGVHPFDFLTRHLPALAAAGFEIYGESELSSRVNRAKPTMSFQVTSGMDWFDLKALIEWGDQQVPLESLRRAIRRDERFIKLADGSVGEIPAEWLEKYKHLFGLSEPQEEGYRVSRHHLALLEDLFAETEQIRVDQKFEVARNWLRNFDGITPVTCQPLSKERFDPTRRLVLTGSIFCAKLVSEVASPTTWELARQFRLSAFYYPSKKNGNARILSAAKRRRRW